MCDCGSYNGDHGDRPTVILDPNDYFDWDGPANSVSVDACIEREIRALWEAGIWTRGCCCGHGRRRPSVVLDTSEDPQDAIRVLGEVDPEREWDVMQWQLVTCT